MNILQSYKHGVNTIFSSKMQKYELKEAWKISILTTGSLTQV